MYRCCWGRTVIRRIGEARAVDGRALGRSVCDGSPLYGWSGKGDKNNEN